MMKQLLAFPSMALYPMLVNREWDALTLSFPN